VVDTLKLVWAAYRSRQFERRHWRWVLDGWRHNEAQGVRYSPELTAAELKRRLSGRRVTRCSAGGVHTAVATLTSNWGVGMVYELQELGPVSVFDWEQTGFLGPVWEHPDALREMNQKLLEFLRRCHGERPIDWVFLPVSGMIVLRSTLKAIKDEFGVPLVNQWLDCKQSLTSGRTVCGQDSGQWDIAPEFDLVWTSARSMCEPYLMLGACPLFLAEGFSPRLTPRVDLDPRHDVGFLGARYGLRSNYIDALRRAGLHVEARGPGWEQGPADLADIGRFFAESRVNLGFGGVGYSMRLTTLKGRDFEVPGAGGAYLTTYNPDLAPYFHIGKEIVCYRDRDECVWLARQLVKDEAWRAALRQNAYERSMREHRWQHRFQHVLGLLGILPSTSQEAPVETASA